MQAPHLAAIDTPVDAEHDHQRNADIGRGIDENGGQTDQGIPFVRLDIGEQAADDPIVIDFAHDVSRRSDRSLSGRTCCRH